MTWLQHKICGILLVKLTGFSPERFLNLCSANEIEIWGVRYTDQGYQFYITVKGFRKVKPFVHKSKVRLRILKKFGLPFFLYRNRKRKLFFTGFASFFILLYTLSLFVWDIEFDGNHMYTYDTLLKFFESQDIQYGMMKRNVDCDAIEEALRSQFSEITWVSARVSGTRLLVMIKENEVLSVIPQKDNYPCDLVADKAGIIKSIIVRQGIPQVAVGDQVEKGQILVSGVLPVTDDSETVVNTHYVHSDADIYAQTEYEYRKTLPPLHEVAVETGKMRKGYYLKLLDYSMMLISKRPKDTHWKLVMEQKQLKLFQNFYLPVYLGKITGKEYITYERDYTEDEKNELAETMHEDYKKKLIQKGVQILENNVKILDSDLKCQIAGHITAIEEIGKIQNIDEPEETIKPDERSGDNN